MSITFKQAESKYETARRLADEAISELQGVRATIDVLERQGVPPDSIIEALTGRAAHPAASEKPSKSHGGKRAVANPGGETWSEAIEKILSHADRPLLVSEIVKELESRGRKFGPNARPDTIVRSTLNRNKERMNWKPTRGKPRKWRKDRTHWSDSREEATGLH